MTKHSSTELSRSTTVRPCRHAVLSSSNDRTLVVIAITASMLVERIGRRKLFLTSNAGMVRLPTLPYLTFSDLNPA
jgi:hypothetical protein